MPFRVPAVCASLYFALQSFIDSADAGVSEQISSVAKADADKNLADADMRATPKMRGRMAHDEPRLLGRVDRVAQIRPEGSIFNTLGDSVNFANLSIINGLAYPCTNVEGRPQLNALMAAARNHEIDCVLVWKFDRFARSTRHLLTALCRGYGDDPDTSRRHRSSQRGS